MTWVAVGVAGASLIGGWMGSNAAKSAGADQAAAARYAADVQAKSTADTNAQLLDINNQNVTRQGQWVQSGQGANIALQQFMGIGGTPGGGATGGGATGGGQMGGPGLIGTGTNSIAGGPTPTGGAALGAQFTGPGVDTTAANYGQGARAPTLADMQTNMNPQYQFMLDQGNQGLSAGAAARGGLLTGQFAKDASNYNIGAAGQGLQQGYNNYVANQTNTYNRLSGMSTTGQNAAAGVGAAGTQTGANIAQNTQAGMTNQTNLATGAANAQAAGQVGAANAWSGAIGTGANTMAYLAGNKAGPWAPAPATA